MADAPAAPDAAAAPAAPEPPVDPFRAAFGDAVADVTTALGETTIVVRHDRLVDTMRALRDTPAFRFEILVDNAGTPSDPFDDEFIEFVDVDRESTGRNDLDGRDFCEDLLQFAV